MMIKKRAFISFDEPCEFECKHCYTYGIDRPRNRSMDEIVADIKDQCFDIVFVSQKNDNFSNPSLGIELCQKAFQRYSTNLFIITRNVLNQNVISQLIELRDKMAEKGKHLFIAVSLNAIESYSVSENVSLIHSPSERIEFIKKLALNNFRPIVMIRPVFPDSMIPVTECCRIVRELKGYISCVVTGGLGINKDILKRLGLKENDFKYISDQTYLQGAIDCEIKFIDVDSELNQIKKECEKLNIPFFLHSMPALNYLLAHSQEKVYKEFDWEHNQTVL